MSTGGELTGYILGGGPLSTLAAFLIGWWRGYRSRR
jgi:hypothetical protein